MTPPYVCFFFCVVSSRYFLEVTIRWSFAHQLFILWRVCSGVHQVWLDSDDCEQPGHRFCYIKSFHKSSNFGARYDERDRHGNDIQGRICLPSKAPEGLVQFHLRWWKFFLLYMSYITVKQSIYLCILRWAVHTQMYVLCSCIIMGTYCVLG